MQRKMQIPKDYFYFYTTGTGFCTDSRYVQFSKAVKKVFGIKLYAV